MDGAIAPARATVDAAELQAEIDGPDRALLLPLAHLVLVLPPPPEGAVSTIVIQWGSEGAIEIPTPGSILWRGALRMRLNCLDRCTETGRIEAARLHESLDRFPDLAAWWTWLGTGWLQPPERSVSRGRPC